MNEVKNPSHLSAGRFCNAGSPRPALSFACHSELDSESRVVAVAFAFALTFASCFQLYALDFKFALSVLLSPRTLQVSASN